MIRVYVVDDEKLVRRGIIGLIDWDQFDMEVVGDSGSGSETVEFIAHNEVDLLFSDLEMPGLSGIPFLQQVKAVRPDIQIVILTMHQEFELIQQALRIGILDYITKAQIEEENIDTLMDHIKKRYMETVLHSQMNDREITGNEVYIWQTGHREQAAKAAAVLEQSGVFFEYLNETCLLLSGESNIIQLKSLVENFDPDTSVLELKQIKGISFSQLDDIMKTSITKRLFEDRRPGCFFYTYIYPSLLQEEPGVSRTDLMNLSLKMEFMMHEDSFNSGMDCICHACLSPEERIAVFYHFNLYWAEFSGKDFTCYFEETGSFKWWYQWKSWFEEIRRLVLHKIGAADDEPETVASIHKAMSYIREQLDREITLEELLRLTGMSKSYFSRNFKKITDKTFVTYMNDLRIDSARKYLVETNQPIYWIARQVGYTDEHYFRRIFKERIGESPRHYRDNNQ